MPVVCGVKFRGRGKVYYFSPGDIEDLEVNDCVVVETARGRELGKVAMPRRQVDDAEIVGELKPILHQAATADLLDACRNLRRESEAMATCQEQVARFGLSMKIVNAEYNYDGARLTFFFTSEQRVDFRELVRELAGIFKTRIELRQIGVRDEAKIVGGMGKCGRPVCCATWLTGFYPVSIRMAKQQDLPLSPMEISGLCGRLLCCLGYENRYYQEVKGRFPKAGKTITTPCGTGKVIRVCVLTETVTVLLEDGSTVELTAEQLAGEVPIEPECRMPAPSDGQRRGQVAPVRMPASTASSVSGAKGRPGRPKTAARPSSGGKPPKRRQEPARPEARTGESSDRSGRGGRQDKERGSVPVRSAGKRSRASVRGAKKGQRGHDGEPESRSSRAKTGSGKGRSHRPQKKRGQRGGE